MAKFIFGFLLGVLLTILFTNGHANAQDYSSLRNSVVAVTNNTGIGTGVVISQDRVLTAAHVVDGGEDVMIQLYGQTMSIAGTVIKKDDKQDWAIVKTPTGKIKPMPFDCRMPVYTEPLATIGYALGIPNLFSKGYVASEEFYEREEGQFILLDIRINHGNSGGPVIDSKGKIIGLAVAMLIPDEGPGVAIMSPLFSFCKELTND